MTTRALLAAEPEHVEPVAGRDPWGNLLGPLALPCVRCDVAAKHGDGYRGCTLICDGCYDGADDAPNRNEHVDEPTAGKAVCEWNVMQQELAAEMDWREAQP